MPNTKIAAANIQERVLEIIANALKCPKEKITLESRFEDDLGADSLDNVELVMSLEDEFELEIQDQDAEKFKTVGQVIEYIEKASAL